MLKDLNSRFCEDESLALAVGAHNLGSTIDLGSQILPSAQPMYYVIKIITPFTSAGAATLQFKVLSDGDGAFGSATELFDSGAIAKATLVAGYEVVSEPIDVSKIERYNKVTGTVGTADGTGGTTTAYWTNVKPVANIP